MIVNKKPFVGLIRVPFQVSRARDPVHELVGTSARARPLVSAQRRALIFATVAAPYAAWVWPDNHHVLSIIYYC
jgi:hypothetical protein